MLKFFLDENITVDLVIVDVNYSKCCKSFCIWRYMFHRHQRVEVRSSFSVGVISDKAYANTSNDLICERFQGATSQRWRFKWVVKAPVWSYIIRSLLQKQNGVLLYLVFIFGHGPLLWYRILTNYQCRLLFFQIIMNVIFKNFNQMCL